MLALRMYVLGSHIDLCKSAHEKLERALQRDC